MSETQVLFTWFAGLLVGFQVGIVIGLLCLTEEKSCC
jgi:hypothetical protein